MKMTNYFSASTKYEFNRTSVQYPLNKGPDLVCRTSLGYWLTVVNSDSGEERDYNQTFLCLHRVEMQALAVCDWANPSQEGLSNRINPLAKGVAPAIVLPP